MVTNCTGSLLQLMDMLSLLHTQHQALTSSLAFTAVATPPQAAHQVWAQFVIGLLCGLSWYAPSRTLVSFDSCVYPWLAMHENSG